jgi:urea transporter
MFICALFFHFAIGVGAANSLLRGFAVAVGGVIGMLFLDFLGVEKKHKT